jgi:hypothetical protein
MTNATATANDFAENKVRFYSFNLVSNKTGRAVPMQMFGKDRDEARERVLEGLRFETVTTKRWTLTDAEVN